MLDHLFKTQIRPDGYQLKKHILSKRFFPRIKLSLAVLTLGMTMLFSCARAQKNVQQQVQNEQYNNRLGWLLSFSVPVIGVEDMQKMKEEVYIFDTRSPEEYGTSYIEGAQHVGYEDFDPKTVADIPKDAPIVLYCSVGYRSEKIGEQLQELGYKNVKNLYGGIFEWANQGKPILSPKGDTTKMLHTYNKKWSKWVDNPAIEKVW